MNSQLKIFFLLIIVGFTYAKDTYTISGTVQNEKGENLKKGSVVLVSKTDGSEIKKTKINRKGEFKLKKITPGKYQINADAEDYLNLVLKNNPDRLEASYGKLVPILVKAVQELSAEVNQLKEKLNN